MTLTNRRRARRTLDLKKKAKMRSPKGIGLTLLFGEVLIVSFAPDILGPIPQLDTGSLN